MKEYTLFSLRTMTLTCLAALMTSGMLRAEDDHTPLEETMEQTSDAIKSLRKIDENDWVALAEAARKAADGIRKGMEFIPLLIKDMPDGKEKTKAIADYRRMMGLSYASLAELELAYLEEDEEKVDEAMKKVKAGKKEGHKKYSDD